MTHDLKTNAGECPACQNDDLEYDGAYADGDAYIYKWKCSGCGISGREVYNLIFDCQEIN